MFWVQNFFVAFFAGIHFDFFDFLYFSVVLLIIEWIELILSARMIMCLFPSEIYFFFRCFIFPLLFSHKFLFSYSNGIFFSLVWSAASASCALKFLFKPVEV